jgi:GxxExxY protein
VEALAARRRKRTQTKGVDTVKDKVFQLCDVVREIAFAVHRYHGPGHLEKVYENALANRLRKLGLDVKQQHSLTVYDEDGTVVGEYMADLFIGNCLIVELKAVRTTADEHVAQLLGYLRASRVEHGLLINFGAAKFSIKKYVMSTTYPFPHTRQSDPQWQEDSQGGGPQEG